MQVRVLIVIVGVSVFVAGERWQTPVSAQGFSIVMDCGATSAPQVRTTLYFGLSRQNGSIDREQSKVLLLVHADNKAARESVQSVIDTYRKAFDQQSVLWESARVCVAA